MSDEIFNSTLKNQQKFIDSFKYGRYPKLLGSSKGGKIYFPVKNNKGTLFKEDGSIITSEENPVDFIIQNGEIKFGISHSWISKKKNVDYAGEIYTDNNGKILSINNNSGHYKPTTEGFDEAMKLLNSKVGKVSDLFNKKY